jgi:biotin carboxylase
MDGETARNFRDKARMKEVLRAHGLPCARHVRVKTPEEALGFVREVGFPVIVKPTAGSGSRDTFRVEDEDQLREVLNLDGAPSGAETMIEEFITGREHSFDSVFLGGRLVWHSVCHYFPRPLDIMENEWMQWCVVIPREADHPRYRDIRVVAERSLQVLGMENGLSHMEWFRRPDGGLAISEVGARPPGAQFVTLISYAHAIDLYRAWAHLMVFDEFAPPERPFAAGAAFLRAQGSGKKITAIRGAEEVVASLRGVAVEVQLPAEGAVPRSGYEGDGYVIVRHPRTEVVEDALDQIVRNIRVELG